MTITRKKTVRQERRVAAELGGHRVPLSGAGAEKGDGRVAQRYTKTATGVQEQVLLPLRIENKLTSKSSYTFSADDWDKLDRSARACGEHPLFHIELSVEGVGSVQVAIIREKFAEHLWLPTPRLWSRDREAKSFNISWARFHEVPYCLHMHGGHRLVVADYLMVRNRLQELQ